MRARPTLVPGLMVAALAGGSAHGEMTFAIVGDMGNSSNATAVADLIKRRSPDHVITAGDNCYGTAPISRQIGTRYGRFVQFRRFWPTLGNHDYSDTCGNGSRAYRTYFDLPNNERYYDVRLGPVHVFAIDSAIQEADGRTATSRQARWFKSRIEASTAPWQIVVFHHAAYSSGSHGSTTDMRWPFEQWGVDAVFSGHDHDYERVLRDDDRDGRKLVYFVTGLGGRARNIIPGKIQGSVFRYNGEFGALFLTATDQKLRFEFRNIKGDVVDSYTLAK